MKALGKSCYGIFGLGVSGLATIAFLEKHGFSFVAWDDNAENISIAKIKYPNTNFAELTNTQWQSIDTLIISPGIPLFFPKPHPVTEIARQKKIEIICDIELFYRFFPNQIYIGITGTNGKSTTTSLIGHVLRTNQINCKVVGNIGTPILSAEPEKDDVIVIEVSSYQLDLITTLRFNAAILLNITKDHIDRHGSIDNYILAKHKVFSHQTQNDLAIINIDHHLNNKLLNQLTSSLSANITFISSEKKLKNCIYIKNDKLYNENDKIGNIPKPLSLLGKHNQENIAAVYACVHSLFKLDTKKIFSSVESFLGLPHRIQYVGKKNHISFVNDSKATNFESTENALKIFNNIYLIAGGIGKEGGIEQIHLFKNKIAKTFLIGKTEEEFSKTLEKYDMPYQKSHNLNQAFIDALTSAKESNYDCVILLSPSAASLDQWKNFEERGNYFIKLSQEYLNGNE